MQPESYYHIYNHANGSENLFRSDENYHYFLRQWSKYIQPIADSYAYCLMPNHFHFLIKTKPEENVLKFLQIDKPTLQGFETLGGFSKVISLKFSHLFNSYTQAFNKMYDRKGSLFIPNFKRKPITSDQYLTTLIHYIHHNPIHHGFCKGYDDWLHSSFHIYSSTKDTQLRRDFGLNWFGGKQKFLDFHREMIQYPEEILFDD